MKKAFKRIAVLLVALIITVGTVGLPDVAEAKVRVGTPKMKNWYESYNSRKDPNATSNGVKYTITWRKVRGASGYQVQKYECDYTWHKHTVSQKGCSTSIEFSSLREIKARVRAYKIVNGRRVYGKWSKTVSKNVMQW